MVRENKILSIQGLRAMMFLLIFFFHSDLYLEQYSIFTQFLVGGGTLAVSVFFVLSGFVAGLSNKTINSFQNYVCYIKMKVGKFYLYHIVFLVLAIPLSYYFFLHEIKGKISLVLDMFLLQSWVSDSTVWRSYNGLAWYLSTLLFCYIVMPIAQKLFDKMKNKKEYMLFIIVLFYIISVALSLLVKNNVEYWLYAFPPVRLLDFYSGYALGRIYKYSSLHGIHGGTKRKYTYIELILLFIMIILMFVYPYVDVGFRRQSLYLPFSMCVVYVFAMDKGAVSKLLSHKYIVTLGNNSFYYYISHQIIFKWIYKIYERIPLIFHRTLFVDFLFVIMCLLITLYSQKIVKGGILSNIEHRSYKKLVNNRGQRTQK